MTRRGQSNFRECEVLVTNMLCQIEQSSNVVETLTVANLGIAVGKCFENVEELSLVAALASAAVKVDVVGEGARQVSLDLVLHHAVGDVHGQHAGVHVRLLLPHPGSSTNLHPDPGSVTSRNTFPDEPLELVSSLELAVAFLDKTFPLLTSP